jgi:beta-glucosidase
MVSRPGRTAGYCAAILGALLGAWSCRAGTSEPEGVLHPRQWPAQRAALAPDAELEARVDRLLARMTPEQKVAQLVQADISSYGPDDVAHYPLGSILNGGNSSPGGDKLAAPREWLELADRFYDAAVTAKDQAILPLLWGTDAVHGHNNVIGATIFPHNIALGAARDPELVRRIGAATALEIRVTGLDWAFAPTVAVARDPRWGRTYESYAEDPALVSANARALLEGLQGQPGTASFLDAAHVVATPKHFLGDGGTFGGVDEGDNRHSEGELMRDAAGFRAALAVGAQTVMISYSSWHGRKMHGEAALLSDVLKGRWGFDGFAIGDWNGHAQLPGCSADNCPAAINAGVDVLMAPDDWRGLVRNTVAAVSSGVISRARVDDAVRRVLRVKLRAHLDQEGRPSARPYAGRWELLGSAEHRALARQAVRESLVLLKNRGHLLPLSTRASVLVAGEAADSIGQQSGGWTIDWQGTESNDYFPGAESIFRGIARCVERGGGRVALSAGGEFTERPDVAIVVFGEQPYAEYRGDRATLEYSPDDQRALQLLQRLHSQHIPVIAVLLAGRPLWVNAELAAADSFVVAWLPGSEGGGVADVLFRTAADGRHYGFRGRLPFAWPDSPLPPGGAGATPARFRYGFGLRTAAANGARRD